MPTLLRHILESDDVDADRHVDFIRFPPETVNWGYEAGGIPNPTNRWW